MKEKQLQDAFAAWLRKIGIPFLRSRMDKATTIRVGWPDFSIFWCGHCLFVETKTAKGRLSDHQNQVITELRRAGNKVVVAYSIEDCVEACKTILCVGKEIANIEPSHNGQSRAVVQSGGAPEGPGRDGNKPLMRNQKADVNPATPKGTTARDTFFIGGLGGVDYVFHGDGRPGGKCEIVRLASNSDCISIKRLAAGDT